MNRRKWTIVAVVAVAVVAAVLVLPTLNNADASDGEGIDAANTSALSRTDIEQIVTATGTVMSADSRSVTAGAGSAAGGAASRIASVNVSEGQAVEKGDVLCETDTELLDLNIKSTRESLKSAEAQYSESLAQAKGRVKDAQEQYDYDKKRLTAEVKKAKKALDAAKKAAKAQDQPSGTAPAAGVPDTSAGQGGATGAGASQSGTASLQTAYDTAVQTKGTTLRADRSAIKSAKEALESQRLMDSTSTIQAQLDTYLKQKEDAAVTAPISGTVTSVNVKDGEYPPMDAPMFVVEDIEHLEIEASVPEYDASILTPGLDAHIVSDAVQDGEWDGKITGISPVATDAEGNFTVTVSVTSEIGKLKSGMSAKLNIVTDSRSGVFAVPYSALIENPDGGAVIYVQEEATPSDGSDGETAAGHREIAVETGLETDYYVEISGNGLEEGLLVLTDPEGLNTEEPESLPTGNSPFGDV